MKTNPYKVIFWILTMIVAGLFVGALLFSGLIIGAPEGNGNMHMLTFSFIAIFMLIIVGFMALIAILVFRDAKKRGMNPWLWATVAVFVPNLIGVIIYLIVRYTVKKPCPHCGRALQGDFNICPYCGADLTLTCAECGEDVLEEWNVCPHCGHRLHLVSDTE